MRSPLVELLDTEPDLAERVEAAVRIAGRRWNVRLKGGIDIRLPEEGSEQAWHRLADYHREHALLDHRLNVVDLRFPDRLIVRKAKEAGTVSETAPPKSEAGSDA